MTPVLDATPSKSLIPGTPESTEALGISSSAIEQLILKHLYFHNELLGRELAGQLGLQFSLIDGLLETLKRQHYVAVKKSLGMGNASAVFALTETGRNLSREALENNQYAGPVPVPLEQYSEMVRKQRLAENWLSPEALDKAFTHLVVAEDIIEQLGPGREFQQVLPDLWAARQWENGAGGSLSSHRYRPNLHALRDRMPGQHRATI
jgi:DNA-binding MarR family transcriptional regulator